MLWSQPNVACLSPSSETYYGRPNSIVVFQFCWSSKMDFWVCGLVELNLCIEKKKSGSEKKRQEHNLASGTTDGSSIERDTLKRTWPGRFQGCFFNCQLGVKSNFVKFSLFYFFTTSWIAVGQSGTYWCRQRLIPAEKGILASSLKGLKLAKQELENCKLTFLLDFRVKHSIGDVACWKCWVKYLLLRCIYFHHRHAWKKCGKFYCVCSLQEIPFLLTKQSNILGCDLH